MALARPPRVEPEHVGTAVDVARMLACFAVTDLRAAFVSAPEMGKAFQCSTKSAKEFL